MSAFSDADAHRPPRPRRPGAATRARSRVPTRATTGAPGIASDDRVLVPPTVSRRAVAIVTGGSTRAGRDIARELAGWAWAIVVAYLEHQRRVETTVGEIISAGGTTVAVRVDLADDLDVQRLYTESIAAFGGVDVVVHTTTEPASLLYQHAARQIRERGAIVSVAAAERIAPEVARQLHQRGITVGGVPPEALLSILARWRQGIG